MWFTKKWTYFSPAIRKHELGWRRRVCRHCDCFVAAGTEQVEWTLTCSRNAGKAKVMIKDFELQAVTCK
jgi:hypothetical protein